MESVVPEEVARFGRDIAAHLDARLGSDFIGAYFVGSIALGGYVPGQSDIDIVAVTAHRLPDDLRRSLATELLELSATCPGRGMELTLYSRRVAASPPAGADFEVNVNGGPRMPPEIHLDARQEPGFWYVIDRAIAHRSGVAIIGPPAADIFADAPPRKLLDAMLQSMRWHRQHEGATLYSVLNASRAWRYAVEGVLGSKLDAAVFARQRWSQPSVIDAAVDLRHGRAAHLDAPEVDRLLDHVESVLAEKWGGLRGLNP